MPLGAFLLMPNNFVLPIIFVALLVWVISGFILRIFKSWSFVNLSTGSNSKFLIFPDVISVLKDPSLTFVKSVDFSNNIILVWSVNTTNSVNCASLVSGSTICIK